MEHPGSHHSSSSSVLFIKGNEFPDEDLPQETTTHIYIKLEHCFVSRFIQRFQFNHFNGQGLLIDWTTKVESEHNYVAPLFTDNLLLIEDISNGDLLRTISQSRDSTSKAVNGYDLLWLVQFYEARVWQV